jgi:hypothetical protein
MYLHGSFALGARADASGAGGDELVEAGLRRADALPDPLDTSARNGRPGDGGCGLATRELPQWADLIERAVADQPDPAKRWSSDSTTELVARTLAFADHIAQPA